MITDCHIILYLTERDKQLIFIVIQYAIDIFALPGFLNSLTCMSGILRAAYREPQANFYPFFQF
jgi:hypothetical protein